MKISARQYAMLLIDLEESNHGMKEKEERLKKIAEIILKNRDAKKIPAIEMIYYNEKKKQGGTIEIIVKSSIGLTEKNIFAIRDNFAKKFALKNKKIEVKNIVDNKIIGGLVFIVGDEIIDDSLKNKILNISQAIG